MLLSKAKLFGGKSVSSYAADQRSTELLRNSTTDKREAGAAVELLKRMEWVTAVLLSAMVVTFLIIRADHAGALWRDECGALQLARMSSIADITRSFQHEAFPLLFPATVRVWTNLWGTSDTALRMFGLVVGIMFVCAAWCNSRIVGSVPLLSLALVGLNSTFLTWGTSVRGYGMGSVLICLAFGLVSKILLKPTTLLLVTTGVVCLASVQCLLHNSVIFVAIGLSAIVVCLIRNDRKRAIIICGLGILCLASLLPYVEPYLGGSPWSVVIKSGTTPRALLAQGNVAIGESSSISVWAWYILLLSLVGGSLARVYVTRLNKPAPDWDLLLFGVLVSVTSLISYHIFLTVLHYTNRPWYYLALIAVLGVTLDLLAAQLSKIRWARIGRLVFATVALVTFPFTVWPRILERQTTVDIVAHKLETSATSTDLIVVSPWQLGITFNWYYHGASPWVTLPLLSDHHIHRYDLLKVKMMSPHPIDDVLEVITTTLRSGGRVWLVGGIRVLPDGETALTLPPAPNSRFGWDNVAYMESWKQQLGAFIQAHTAGGQWVALPVAGPVNNLENIPLAVVQGWLD